jgi:hypothetical protein
MLGSYSSFSVRVGEVARKPISDLVLLFGDWVRLPQDFGKPFRDRIFSPLKDFLALPRPSSFPEWFLSGSGETGPGLALYGAAGNRFFQHVRLLQGSRTPSGESPSGFVR